MPHMPRTSASHVLFMPRTSASQASLARIFSTLGVKGVQNKKPSEGGEWIFSGTAHVGHEFHEY